MRVFEVCFSMRIIRLSAIPVIPGLLRSRFIKSNSAFILSFMLGSAITYFFCSFSKPLLTNIDKTTGEQKLQKLSEKLGRQNDGLSPERSEKVSEKTFDLHKTIKETTIPPTTVIARKEVRYPPLVAGDGKILTPVDGCNGNYFIVFVVITSSRKFAARKSIRSSWGTKFSSTVSENFKVVFVLGCDNDNDKRVEREATKYQDIIRGNYKDDFRQNEYHSVKSLLGLQWASTTCQSKYVMLSYDETFVNVATTIKWIKSLENDSSSKTAHRKGLFAGFCHGATRGGASVVRNPKSQWYISKEEYKEDRLPPYASGTAIVLSSDVVATIVDLSKQVIFFLYLILHQAVAMAITQTECLV